MVAVLGIAESSRATLLAELDRIGSNLLTVAPGQTFLGDDAALPDDVGRDDRPDRPGRGRVERLDHVDATVRRTDLIPTRARPAASPSRPPTTTCSRRSEATLAAGRFIDDAVDALPGGRARVRSPRSGSASRSLDAPVAGLDRRPVVDRRRDPRSAAARARDRPVGARRHGGARRSCSDTDVVADDDLRPRRRRRIDDVRAVLAGERPNPENPEAVDVSRPSDAIEARAAAATAFTDAVPGARRGRAARRRPRHRQRDADGRPGAAQRDRPAAGARGDPRPHRRASSWPRRSCSRGSAGSWGRSLGSAVAAAYATSPGLGRRAADRGLRGGRRWGPRRSAAIAGLYPALRAANLAADGRAAGLRGRGTLRTDARSVEGMPAAVDTLVGCTPPRALMRRTRRVRNAQGPSPRSSRSSTTSRSPTR